MMTTMLIIRLGSQGQICFLDLGSVLDFFDLGSDDKSHILQRNIGGCLSLFLGLVQ